MKIAVFGSNGMAGSIITKYLKQQKYSVTTIARNNADIMLDIEDVNLLNKTILQLVDFDFVINCVGLLVKDSQDRPDRAILINGWFPHFLENTYKNTKTKIIHLSTDCVFNGQKGLYNEDDIHTEANYYGKSKSYGEIDNNKDVTFRMSIIGPEIKKNGSGLFNWVVNNTERDIPGWDNAWWNGMTTLQLAKCIDYYMNNCEFTGIYHLVNNDNKITKYDLLLKINDTYKLNKNILKISGPKPVNKILIDNRQLFKFEIPSYDIQLKELCNFV